MKIGYTIRGKEEEDILLNEIGCEKVITPSSKEYLKEWEQAIACAQGHELVVINLLSTGLLVNQLGTQLNLLVEEPTVTVTFWETTQITSSCYKALLIQLAQQEKQVMSERTHDGLEKAYKLGRKSGRPTVNEKTIKKIQYLRAQKMTFRNISIECGVSLGTVHKYINLLEDSHHMEHSVLK
ncbi:recombinase family protein [Vagococcus sp. BWB3-3]|uniref:Recombinase family protein n=1 Tax=Vagococcus allomyrinae TaxID=2794353 RepID=A0A940SUE9_9ENTE|nr:recombinase family protein [Vagococcus allomyrinae]MBP1044232.1 recombinase family protein [Vagococcus allomyrinae]